MEAIKSISIIEWVFGVVVLGFGIKGFIEYPHRDFTK